VTAKGSISYFWKREIVASTPGKPALPGSAKGGLAFGTVAVSAGVIGDAQAAAGVAAVHPLAQLSGAAV
jgi:hypothetical protein